MEETLGTRTERAVAQGCAVAAALRARHLQRSASRGGLPEVCLRRLGLGRVFDRP
ncbi:hypothetical protein [Rhodobacter sp. CZR27]|uniref:hypothetical protein n=1 Tax=Rhodobacter sp. CZR27 TaxID=2033869 RepID=UPI0012FD6262|nr:hypothetical protein [Rhodobacter sp. CZR27]